MKNNIQLSVIIVTKEKKELLLELIYALLNQSLDRNLYEIIVVDTGITNNTEEFLIQNGIIKQIKYFHQKNSSTGYAKNAGLRYSEGSSIVFISDYMLPEYKFLEIHLRFIRTYPDIAVIGYSKREKPPVEELPVSSSEEIHFEDIENTDNVDYHFFNTHNMSIQKDKLESAGGVDEGIKNNYLEDIELGWRLFQNPDQLKLVFTEDAYCVSRVPEFSLENCISLEYEHGQALQYINTKYPDRTFEQFMPVKKKSIMNLPPGLKIKFDKLMLFILDNTIPFKKAIKHYYADILDNARYMGFKHRRPKKKK